MAHRSSTPASAAGSTAAAGREAVIVYGGRSSCNGRLPGTEQALRGQTWDGDTLRAALAALDAEVAAFPMATDEEGFTPEYRRQLARGFFYKFFLHVSARLAPGSVAARNGSASGHRDRPVACGEQHFTTSDSVTPLTRPIAKRAAFSQAAGEIRYPSDEPLPTTGCHGVPVTSRRAHARFRFARPLTELEAELRHRFPGFVALVTAADVPGANLIGLGGDDPVFFDGEVTCVGAPVALAVADTRKTASAVAAYVGGECVVYDVLPAIVTLDQAVARARQCRRCPACTGPDGRHVVVTREGAMRTGSRTPRRRSRDDTPHGRADDRGPGTSTWSRCATGPGPYDQMTVSSSTQNPNGDQGRSPACSG